MTFSDCANHFIQAHKNHFIQAHKDAWRNHKHRAQWSGHSGVNFIWLPTRAGVNRFIFQAVLAVGFVGDALPFRHTSSRVG
jgi:hypothetical protein